MKSDSFHGTVGVVALLAQLVLVLAAQINSTSEYSKNIVNNTNSNPAPVRHLDRSFEERVHILTNALNAYSALLQHSNDQPRAERLISETSSSTPTTTMSQTTAMPQTSSTVPPSKDIIEEMLRNLSTLQNNPKLSLEEKRFVEHLKTSFNAIWVLLDKEASRENDPEVREQLGVVVKEMHNMQTRLENNQKEVKGIHESLDELKSGHFLDQIVVHINSDNFAMASQKLRNGSNNEYIYVVRKVYLGDTKNFQLLLRFAKAVHDFGQKLKIYNALFKEIGYHDHKDSRMLVQITKQIKKDVLDRATGYTKIDAKALLDDICTLDIVENLQSNKLDLVQQRLEMGDNDTYKYAVLKVYHPEGDNFDLIIRFAEFVQDTELRLKLCQTLYYTMNLNDRKNLKKLHELTRCVKTEVLDRATGATASDAQAFLNILCTDVTTQHLKSGDFESAGQMLNIGNNNTYMYALNKVYGFRVVDFESLLSLEKYARNLGQKFLFYEVIYNATRADEIDLQKLEQLRLGIKREIIFHGASHNPVLNTMTLLYYRIIHDEAIGYLWFGNFPYCSMVLDMCDYDAYEWIVRDMYEKAAKNFDLLMSFGDFELRWTQNQDIFFEVLYKVMRTNGCNDTNEMFELSQTLEIGIPYAAPGLDVFRTLTLLKHVRYDCVIDFLKSGNFILAEQKLVNGPDDAYVFVVKGIYNQDQHPENFELLLNFANSSQNVAAKFKLYDTLINTTRNSRSQDSLKQLLRLYTSVKNEINTNLKNYNTSESLIDALKDAIFDRTVEPICSGFMENAILPKAQQLSYEISKVDIELLYSVYGEVMKKMMVFKDVSYLQILERESYSLTQLIERMAMHEAIITTMIESDQFIYSTNRVTVKLAVHMRAVQNNSTYGDIPQYWRSRYNELKNKLPLITKTIIFSPVVCIKNTAYDDNYLYASEERYDSKKRHVYVGPLQKENLTSSHRWKVRYNPAWGVHFVNEKFDEELFPSKDIFYNGDNGTRFVFTARNEDLIHSASLWNLDTNDRVDARSVQMLGSQNEYIYADSRNGTDQRHFAFTKKHNSMDTEARDFIWEIVDCS